MQSSITTYFSKYDNYFTKLNLKEFFLEDNGYVQFSPHFLSQNYSYNLYQELLNYNYEQKTVKMYDKNIKIPRKYSIINFKQDCISNNINILRDKLESITNKKFNYVLINYYRDGNDYIAYHSDNEAVGDNINTICSVSIGASRKFLMKNINTKKLITFILNNGSLLIMQGNDTQLNWKHSVPKSKKCNEIRFNLTFRQ